MLIHYARFIDCIPKNRLIWIILLLGVLVLACSLPVAESTTPATPSPTFAPTETPQPTPTQQPLPPAIVETSPIQDGELALDGQITLYFNQAMDRTSVESALSTRSRQDVRFDTAWPDETTLVLLASEPLEPEMDLEIELDNSAQSLTGMGLLQPLKMSFHTTGYLEMTQTLPEGNTIEVDPSSAVVAAFNRPVVALGGDADSHPSAFEIDPASQGHGEWLNTSTYIFYPQPAFMGGNNYTVTLNEDLQGTDGSPLADVQTWTFSTALPELVSVEPETEVPVELDAVFQLTFNQGMDPPSVEANFNLVGPDGATVTGEASWNEDNTIFTFTPSELLVRDSNYSINLKADAQGRGGTTLGKPFSAQFRSAPDLAINRTEPNQGGSIYLYGGPVLYFTAPVQDENLSQFLSMDPEVHNLDEWWDAEQNALHLHGEFEPSATYSLTVSSELVDIWGGKLGENFQYKFNIDPLPPEIQVSLGSEVLFLTPEDSSLIAQSTNIGTIPLSVGTIPQEDFFYMFKPDGYEFKRDYSSTDKISWTQEIENMVLDHSQPVEVFLTPDQTALAPGLYFLRFDFTQENVYGGPYLMVVSNIQTTFKLSATDALVWAVDLRDNSPLSDAPVTIYDDNGTSIAEGRTDADGVFKTSVPPRENPYSTVFAVLGQPGDEDYGLALSTWDQGIASWDFGITSDFSPPGLKVYMYTDRPIYRPGQTVYFKAVVREADNGRYTLPEMGSLPVTINGFDGQEMASMDLPLSTFGTIHGEFALPEDTKPGNFNIVSTAAPNDILGFQVAEYRKPEINLQVSFDTGDALVGQDLITEVNARYFFDAPAGNLPLNWALYAAPTYFSIPGYQVGPLDTGWLDSFHLPFFGDPLGILISEGSAETNPNGLLTLELPAQDSESRQLYTLEVTIEDDSGFPVSSRTSIEVNPSPYYIGVRPDQWVGRAQEPTGFDMLALDWEKTPVGGDKFRAELNQVEWVWEETSVMRGFSGPEAVPQYTAVASTDFIVSDQGQARVSFTPSEPGTYQLDVFGIEPDNEAVRSEVLIWVRGSGRAKWPNLPNSRLQITSDQDNYLPGENAQVFIPNPFGEEVLALITLERGKVMSYQVMAIEAEGHNLDVPLSADEAPNVYMSVTLIGRDTEGNPDFKLGYVNLPVAPIEQTLSVKLISQPERTGPGDQVSFEIQVTDTDGNPIQGEFSLAVVDLAALALADPNSKDILSAFYDERPLGVRTGLSLAAYVRRQMNLPEGLGGGGDGLFVPEVVREKFPDTAYWNAKVITDKGGKALVSVSLPDSLTTWQVDARGVTAETLVGDEQTQILTSKDLIIRPVTPRFLVENDHVQIAAILHNNTSEDLLVDVSLQANGFVLDDSESGTQQVTVPAAGRARVEWWGRALETDNIDLIFSAEGRDTSGLVYKDTTKPAAGTLPVRRFISGQTFRTAGVMDEGGEILELVSLPRSFEPDNGELKVELSPSLAAAMMDALDALEHNPYDSSEGTVSRFLPNLEAYQVLSEFGVDTSGIEARLDRTLSQGLQNLLYRQNLDGGWGWWQGGESDPYITAYVLFGINQALEAGATLGEDVFQRATEFLISHVDEVETAGYASLEPWELDRLAFERFVLSQIGEGDLQAGLDLYSVREQLNPWSRALLALTLEKASPGSNEARTLISDLESTAVRSSTGMHWEMILEDDGYQSGRRNMINTISNSAIVVYALAQRDPGSPLLPDAVRYLMAHRGANGAWSSTYTSAWTTLALVEVMRGTGELGGDFAFAASLNGSPLASGEASGAEQLTPVRAAVSLGDLYPQEPNALIIQREDGPGRLYYTAGLKASRPVGEVAPLAEGLSISRSTYSLENECEQGSCKPIQSAEAGERVRVRLTLTLPNDAYHILVEDYIPAGGEIIDSRLKTSQIGEGDAPKTEVVNDLRQPFENGWGWWRFHEPLIYDEHITWAADYLPAGTYELTYTMVLAQAGEFQVLPARAWQFYFPEVQANSSGEVFKVLP